MKHILLSENLNKGFNLLKSFLIVFLVLFQISFGVRAQNNLKFDGVDDYVATPISSDFNMHGKSFTLECRVWADENLSTEEDFTFIGGGDATWVEGDYFLGSWSDKQLSFGYHGWSVKIDNLDWTDNTWHHIAGVYDKDVGVAGELRIYVDGVLQNTGAPSTGVVPDDLNVPLHLGSRGGGSQFANVVMDEVRVWEEARSETEIQTNMNSSLASPNTEANLVAYYTFDDISGTTLPDNSANSHDGTLYNFEPREPNTSDVLKFDGINDNVELSETLNIGSSSNTIEAWVKVPEVGSDNLTEDERVGILLGNFEDTPNSNWEIYNKGQIRMYWNHGQIEVTGTTDLRDNQWHHIAFVRDNVQNTILMYVDGVIEPLTYDNGTGGGSDITFTTTHRIGADNRNSGTPYFHGYIDEMRIWDNARSQEQIQQNMSVQLSGSESNLIAYYTFDDINGATLPDNSKNNNYGTLQNFTPTVSTETVTSITANSATGNGNLNDLGYPDPTAYGFCWNTSGNPTTSDNSNNLGGTTSIGSYTSSITGLSENTTYFIRAYATNDAGTSYGNIVSFTTPYEIPADISVTPSTIAENQAVGTTVGTVSAAPAGTYSFDLVSGVGDTDNSSFSLKVNSTEDQNSGAPSQSIGLFPGDIWQSFKAGKSGVLTQIGLMSPYNPQGTFTMKLKVFEGEGIDGESLGEATAVLAPDANDYIMWDFNGIIVTQGSQYTFQLSEWTEDIGLYAWEDEEHYPDGQMNYASYSGCELAFKTYVATSTDLIAESSFDYESKSSYTTRIKATNPDGNSYEEALTINVSNVNETPTGIALSSSSADENVAQNSTIGTLSTTDPDAGNTFIYSFASGTGSTDNSSFTISGNDLLISESPDYETKNSYSIRIRTTDQGGLAFDKAFLITVNDINESPIATAPSAPTVYEDDSDVAIADDIEITDEDGDDQMVSFNITGGMLTIGNSGITFGGDGNGSSVFTASGTITAINTALDAATFTPTANYYGTNAGAIAFTANDGVDDSNNASVSFDIIGVNDAPVSSDFTASPGPYQNVVYTFATSDFDYSDIESDPLNHVRITAVPDNGTLYVDTDSDDEYDAGEELSNGAWVSKTNLDAGDLQYYTEVATNTNFSFDVNDGKDYSTSTYTATLNITPAVSVLITSQTNVLCYGDSDGTLTATVTPGAPDYDYSWSNGATTMNTSSTTNTVSGLSAGTYTVTVTDAVGNTASGSATITVEDKTAPSVLTKDITVQLDANGSVSIVPTDVDDGSSDNCGIESYSLDVTDFSCNNIGANTVILTVTDENNNSSTADAVVTVVDDIDPTAVAQNVTVYLDADGNASLTAEEVDNGSNDACGIASLELSKTDFTCDNVGENTVTLTVTDVNGNTDTATSTVTVVDNIDPTAIAQNVTIYLDADGKASTSAGSVNNGSNDNCSIAKLSLSQTGFDCSHVGANPVTLTITDVNGNTDTATSTVTVVDNIDPTAVAQNVTIYLDADGNASTSAGSVNNGSNDNCGIATLALSQTDFDCSHVGDNAVTLTVTDVNGNTDTTEATVTVVDDINPTAIAQNVTIYLDADGKASTSAGSVNNGSNDNCSIANMALSQTDFDCSHVGDNAVTLTVTDVNGNTDTAEATVTVVDDINPTAIAQNVTIYLDADGKASTSADDVNNGSSDNCSIANLALSQTDFDCSHVGDNAVTLTVTDVNGNTDTAEATVTVVDDINPTAIAQNVTIYLDADGNASITAEEVDDGSKDACGIASLELSQTDFDCSHVGTNEVTLTVADNNGNVSTATAIITVKDNVAPFALAQSITVHLDENGEGSTTTEDMDNGSNDACGIASLELSQTDFDCSHVGENTVTLTVTDVNNNSSTADAVVTVVDDIDPIAVAQDVTIYLDADGNASITAEEVDDGSNDACGVASLELSQTDFDCSHVGDNTVTLTVTDANGNNSACSANITVLDTVSPIIKCNPIEIALRENGEYILNLSNIREMASGTSDACTPFGQLVLDVYPKVFECIHTNKTIPVTLSAVDINGNVSECTTFVIVKDTIPPHFEPIKDIIVDVPPDVCETEVTYRVPVVKDSCTVTITQIEGLGSNSTFPTGTTTETWQATDQAGNISTVSFDVIVTSENDLPTIHSISDILVDEDAPLVEVELTGISYGIDCEEEEDVMVSAEVGSGMELVALDSVMYTTGADSGMLLLSITPDMSGDAEVMVTVVDEAGDTVTTSFMVTVTPVNDAPVLVSPIADQTVNASYELAIAVSDVLGEYFDDPDGDPLTLTAMLEDGSELPDWVEIVGDTLYATPMIADTGCYTMVVEASDPDGLTATDTFQVCVEGYPTSIDDNGAGEFEVNLYPNPTQGMVNVDIESSTAREIELTVLDITGKQVMRKQFSAAERITFDMSGKVSGMYFVKLDFEGQQVLKKLIVDRK